MDKIPRLEGTAWLKRGAKGLLEKRLRVKTSKGKKPRGKPLLGKGRGNSTGHRNNLAHEIYLITSSTQKLCNFCCFLIDVLIQYTAEMDTQVNFETSWKTSQNVSSFTTHSLEFRTVVGSFIRKPYRESCNGAFIQTSYQARHSLDCLVLRFLRKLIFI